jgi:hypothetical protein
MATNVAPAEASAPGEIVASTVATHLAGPLDGITFEDRGETG